MSNTISGGISFSGIGSGTDFNEIIAQLKEVESIKLYNLEDSRDVANESYEAYQELLDVIAEAQEALGNLDSPSKFLTKIAASSDEATIGVKADAEAVDGTHKIEVKQLASNAIWASTHTYDDKTTVINTTSAAIDFTYTYKGETQTLAVPPGTTLEGFANMLNENKANPGVQMSMMKTADGYTFQISGKESGADANLQILPSNLLGMTGAAGAWQSSSAVDLSKPLNDGDVVNSYTYKLTFNDGSTLETDPVAGDATQDEIYNAIIAKDPTAATLVNGNMVINDLRSIETISETPGTPPTSSSTTSKVTPTTSFSLDGTLRDSTIADSANYVFTNADNEAVNIVMTGSHTQHDILQALNAKGYKVTATEDTATGKTDVSIDGITNVDAFLATESSTPSSTTSEAFSVQGPLSGMTLPPKEYTFTNDNGATFTVSMTEDHTPEDVLNAINTNGYKTVITEPADPAASPTGIAIEGLSNFDDFYVALQGASSAVSPITEITTFGINGDLDAIITGGATYNFVDATGATVPIVMASDHSQQDVLDALNATGHTVTSFGVIGGQHIFTAAGISNVNDLLATDTGRIVPTTTWPAYSQALDSTAPIQSGIVPEEVTISFAMSDGTSKEVTVTNDQTMAQVLAAAGITYSQDADGKLTLDNVAAVTGIPGSVGVSGSATSSDVWAIQGSQDAIFKVDNWPQDLTSSTNEVADVLEGITLTLRDVGTAQITVAADTDSVKDNIQTVLDAFNSVLKKIQDLTAITEDVSPTYDEYGNAGMDTTEGSALTGDYSVQAFAGRLKDSIGGHPPGFQPMTADDIFSGDFIASLAMMGIKVSSDIDSADYGLFTIAPHGSTDEIQAFDQALFDDAIANHLEDVIDFFASDSVGTSSSPNFRYANHIDGLTEPGTYEVTYDVGVDGAPYNVMINGFAASKSDTQPNTFSVGNAGGASGMAITIDNLTQGSYSGTVSVQQGKVNQMIDFFMAELKYVEPKLSDPSLGDDNGALMIAKESYAEQIRSYDEQISEEMERLERWETREKLKYARLDTLLGDYNGNMEILNQQLAQLG